jgi:SAM-dependent methyltransferase
MMINGFKELTKGIIAGPVLGHCPICERRTVLIKLGPWLRDQFICVRCKSIPRHRALIHILQTRFPNWRNLRIHESSPGGAPSKKLLAECGQYIPTHFFTDIPSGNLKNEIRSENLEYLGFSSSSFDLVITSDVLEHLLAPAKCLAEIMRTLVPRGAHVFTVPWFWWKGTLIRAVRAEDGTVTHIEKPDYHGNPIDSQGSLVVTEWGRDLCDFIYRSSGATTTAILIHDRRLGIEADFNEVFISTKPG